MLLCLASAADAMIDAAVHVWGNGSSPFPYAPGVDTGILRHNASASQLVALMDEAGVAAALIVQPIDYRFDHSYVTAVLNAYPSRFRGFLLADPTQGLSQGVQAMTSLRALGFVGTRFNPSLFVGGLDSELARAMFAAAGTLDLVVGVMVWPALTPHYDGIVKMLEQAPSTKLIIDHWGFFRSPPTGGQMGNAGVNDENCWQLLLSLARFPQVYVKLSANFRVSAERPPFMDLAPRLAELLQAYGPSRLMVGTDFPFCLSGGGSPPNEMSATYGTSAGLAQHWASHLNLSSEALDQLTGGTAATLLGFATAVSDTALAVSEETPAEAMVSFYAWWLWVCGAALVAATLAAVLLVWLVRRRNQKSVRML